jgi:hypothetical protein
MADKKSERDERLANALRENLKRRKAGVRGMDQPKDEQEDRRPERSVAQSKGAGTEA